VRQLTFGGFLESYTKALSGENTRSLRRLAGMALTQPRVTEPLMLLAVVTQREQMLAGAKLLDSELSGELHTLVTLHQSGRLESALAAGDPQLRTEYVKVWNSYVARRDVVKRDANLKLDVRERVLALEATKHVTRYRMAKDLGLNPGNLHAFLAHGEPSKLSLDRAYKLLDYMNAA